MSENSFFSRLIGHDALKSDLARLVKNNRVPHALLFCGPEGVGKRLAAYGLAAELLHLHGATPRTVFHLLRSGSHPDLHPLEREEDKKDISVENIRELRSALQLQPFLGSASVAVIDNAHLMSTAASNALLLTLEEPAQGRFLILVSHAPQKLPETIISRCQSIRFGALDEKSVTNILQSLFPKTLSDKQLYLLKTLAHESLGPLGLSSLVHPRTLLLSSETAAGKHLNALFERARTLEASLTQAFAPGVELPGDSLSLASLLSEEKGDELSWLLLRTVARQALRNASPAHAEKQAELLLQALEAERLVRERNASPQLQLSSLFLKAGEG